MHFHENDSLTTKIETWLKKSSKPKVRFDTAEGLENAWDLVKKINKMQKLNLKLPNLSRMSCRPGIPVAPRALRYEMKDGYDDKHKTVLLRWWPSQIYDENDKPCQIHKLVGYRIYVNGHPKGMIKPHKTRALVEGLRVQHEYKITVVAIGAIGESIHSNAAIIYVPSQAITGDKYIEKPTEEPKPTRKPTTMAPREVESIDDIIKEVKSKCNQKKPSETTEQDIKESKTITPESSTQNSSLNESSTDYDKLLDQLDEEKDEDVIERVLQRYGLNGDDFEYAKPEAPSEPAESMDISLDWTISCPIKKKKTIEKQNSHL